MSPSDPQPEVPTAAELMAQALASGNVPEQAPAATDGGGIELPNRIINTKGPSDTEGTQRHSALDDLGEDGNDPFAVNDLSPAASAIPTTVAATATSPASDPGERSVAEYSALMEAALGSYKYFLSTGLNSGKEFQRLRDEIIKWHKDLNLELNDSFPQDDEEVANSEQALNYLQVLLSLKLHTNIRRALSDIVERIETIKERKIPTPYDNFDVDNFITETLKGVDTDDKVLDAFVKVYKEWEEISLNQARIGGKFKIEGKGMPIIADHKNDSYAEGVQRLRGIEAGIENSNTRISEVDISALSTEQLEATHALRQLNTVANSICERFKEEVAKVKEEIDRVAAGSAATSAPTPAGAPAMKSVDQYKDEIEVALGARYLDKLVRGVEMSMTFYPVTRMVEKYHKDEGIAFDSSKCRLPVRSLVEANKLITLLEINCSDTLGNLKSALSDIKNEIENKMATAPGTGPAGATGGPAASPATAPVSRPAPVPPAVPTPPAAAPKMLTVGQYQSEIEIILGDDYLEKLEGSDNLYLKFLILKGKVFGWHRDVNKLSSNTHAYPTQVASLEESLDFIDSLYLDLNVHMVDLETALFKIKSEIENKIDEVASRTAPAASAAAPVVASAAAPSVNPVLRVDPVAGADFEYNQLIDSMSDTRSYNDKIRSLNLYITNTQAEIEREKRLTTPNQVLITKLTENIAAAKKLIEDASKLQLHLKAQYIYGDREVINRAIDIKDRINRCEAVADLDLIKAEAEKLANEYRVIGIAGLKLNGKQVRTPKKIGTATVTTTTTDPSKVFTEVPLVVTIVFGQSESLILGAIDPQAITIKRREIVALDEAKDKAKKAVDDLNVKVTDGETSIKAALVVLQSKVNSEGKIPKDDCTRFEIEYNRAINGITAQKRKAIADLSTQKTKVPAGANWKDKAEKAIDDAIGACRKATDGLKGKLDTKKQSGVIMGLLANDIQTELKKSDAFFGPIALTTPDFDATTPTAAPAHGFGFNMSQNWSPKGVAIGTAVAIAITAAALLAAKLGKDSKEAEQKAKSKAVTEAQNDTNPSAKSKNTAGADPVEILREKLRYRGVLSNGSQSGTPGAATQAPTPQTKAVATAPQARPAATTAAPSLALKLSTVETVPRVQMQSISTQQIFNDVNSLGQITDEGSLSQKDMQDIATYLRSNLVNVRGISTDITRLMIIDKLIRAPGTIYGKANTGNTLSLLRTQADIVAWANDRSRDSEKWALLLDTDASGKVRSTATVFRDDIRNGIRTDDSLSGLLDRIERMINSSQTSVKDEIAKEIRDRYFNGK